MMRFALFPAGDQRLFQIELAFDLAAALVGDLSVTQQLKDVLALGGDQLHAQAGGGLDCIPALIDGLRELLAAGLVAGTGPRPEPPPEGPPPGALLALAGGPPPPRPPPPPPPPPLPPPPPP